MSSMFFYVEYVLVKVLVFTGNYGCYPLFGVACMLIYTTFTGYV